jgi:HD superfamily phosphohydrolase
MMDTVRDPLWQTIRLDALARRLVDTPVVQRLRYVRQLGHAHLVYPGANHSRFEHALGAHELARRTVALLDEGRQLDGIDPIEGAIARAAALLHDVGHYPYSHALEEIGVPHHEAVAAPLITSGPVAEILREALGASAPARVMAMIRGDSESPLAGLISGSTDLDKLEYLRRDALMCGVPYGVIDVDRLMHALVVVTDPTTGRLTIGVRAKGLSALESLLFAKYQMYRNVYWHHAVRSATAMYKRMVEDALAEGRITAEHLAGFTDEGLLHALGTTDQPSLLIALRDRRLFKRIAEAPAADLDTDALEWIATDRGRVRAAEAALAHRVGLRNGEVLIDFPAKTQMLGLDLPLLERDGTVGHLTNAGRAGAIDLPAIAASLYRSARWLRVFAARPAEVSLPDVLGVLAAH